jgi:putative phosphoserine phosphatase/1-acylglycerol-3-phosphate O-acyltransferase
MAAQVQDDWKSAKATPHGEVIRNVEAMESGPRIGALFDFDGTLISGYSALAFVREQLRKGQMSVTDFLELVASMANLAMGRIGFSAAMTVSARILRGVSEQSYTEFGEEIYQKHLARSIYPEARALVQSHQRKGHTVAIVSSATPYQVRPAARDLRIGHVLCTRLEVEDGRFTGAVIRPTCSGRGKVTAVERLAAETGIDLGKSVFYSDSHDDLPLLERIGQPQILNPDRKLESVANRRGWPVRRFTSRERPGASDYLRSLGVYGSLLSSALVGLGIWGLSGSKNDGRRAMISLWADIASALVGLKLKVIGEEKIWANRPAVVITNHQSQADAIIIMKLLRGNFAAVGKKEITNIPLVSQAIQFAGVIPIDRKDPKKAIESMKPLIQALRSEGRFVAVAAEGTRSTSTLPGPFKKGAFHIAMQAGVPILPIVIHNAIDVQPKGDFVFRPATVLVEVLDPIDTSTWTAEDLAARVAEVRNIYLRKLGYPEEDVPASGPATGPTGATTAPKRRARRPLKTAPRARVRKTNGSSPALKQP